MAKWKRRDPRNKFIEFLEHLDSYYYDVKRREIGHLKRTFSPYAEKLIQQFEEEGFIEKKRGIIELKIKGYKYLDYLREVELKRQLLEYEGDKILFNALTALSIISTLVGGFSRIPLLLLTAFFLSLTVFVLCLVRYFSFKKIKKKRK